MKVDQVNYLNLDYENKITGKNWWLLCVNFHFNTLAFLCILPSPKSSQFRAAQAKTSKGEPSVHADEPVEGLSTIACSFLQIAHTIATAQVSQSTQGPLYTPICACRNPTVAASQQRPECVLARRALRLKTPPNNQNSTTRRPSSLHQYLFYSWVIF